MRWNIDENQREKQAPELLCTRFLPCREIVAGNFRREDATTICDVVLINLPALGYCLSVRLRSCRPCIRCVQVSICAMIVTPEAIHKWRVVTILRGIVWRLGVSSCVEPELLVVLRVRRRELRVVDDEAPLASNRGHRAVLVLYECPSGHIHPGER